MHLQGQILNRRSSGSIFDGLTWKLRLTANSPQTPMQHCNKYIYTKLIYWEADGLSLMTLGRLVKDANCELKGICTHKYPYSDATKR